MITKKYFRNLVPGTPEYVIAHAKWRKKRGKLNSSESFSLIKNPNRALVIAKNYIDNYNQFPEKKEDIKIQDEIVIGVETYKDGGSVINTDCGYLGVDKETGIIPKVGQLVRFYFMGRDAGIGSTIRGLDFEGKHCRYKTEQQIRDDGKKWLKDQEKREKQKFEDEKSLLDKRYNQFPAVFKRRIDKFRKNNPDFRWKYEGSESELCRQAVLVAKYLHGQAGTKLRIGQIPKKAKEPYDLAIRGYARYFHELPVKMQVKLVKGFDEFHSGNSSAHVIELALCYLTDPKKVVSLNGWLSAICGRKEFGDVPREQVA